MANKILIEVVGQGQGLDEVNAKLEQTKVHEKELIAQMDKLSAQKQQWAGAAKVVAEFDKEIAKVESELKKVRKEQDNARKSIEDLSNAQKAMPGKVIAENTTKSFRTLKREIDEQLRTWDDWSASGTEAYNKLMAKAGEMNDTMGDTNRMIQYMGSDTKGFDTLVDGTQAIAGGFSVAQGAIALFGSESEDLQLMMVKLQSAIAVSTGLQQIGNVVQKESNLMMGIAIIQNKAKATSELLSTKTTIGATVAQRAFNLVAKANPYVILALALITVVGALVAFTSGSNKAKKEQEKLNYEISRTTNQIKGIEDNSNFDVAIAEAAGKSKESIMKMRLEAARAANELAYLTMGQVMSNNSSTKEQRDEAVRMEQETYNKVKSILDEMTVYEITKKTESLKKSREISNNRLQKLKEDQQKEFDATREYYTKVNEASIQAEVDAKKIALTPIPVTEEVENEVKSYLDILQHQYNMGVMSYEEYLNKKKEYLILSGKDLDAVNEEIHKNEQDKLKEHEEKKKEIMQQSVQLIGEIGNILFDHKKEQLSQEMSDLEHYYTTDAEEAKANKDMKLITEEEMSAKQLEIKRKQAKADKEQALFNIAISTATGIMSALGSLPPNPILAAFIGVTGAAQAIAIASKPLPKYAKGRKSGRGEFAMVGEYGPELMWVPEMAGIMPANETQRALNGDAQAFERWNMPVIDSWIPLPDISQRVTQEINRKDTIDYDKLASKIGEHVGRNIRIPKSKNVTVNVDKSGITVEEGNTTTRLLNKKYGI